MSRNSITVAKPKKSYRKALGYLFACLLLGGILWLEGLIFLASDPLGLLQEGEVVWLPLNWSPEQWLEMLHPVHSFTYYLFWWVLARRLLYYTLSFIFWCYFAIFVYLKNSWAIERLKFFAGFLFLGPVWVSLHTWYYFDTEVVGFQFVYRTPLIEALNIEFIVGLDGVVITFLLLTTFIMMLCWFAAAPISTNYLEFVGCLLFIEVFLILTFSVLDLFLFYIFFESVLIPMFILIGFWGARERKIRAAYYFFLYTLAGSLLMLFGILYIYILTGTTDFEVLLNTQFTQNQQLKLWACFFIPFAVKIPMFPFHIWLPEAHVEAPTVGSMILASLLLKLGGYGFLRFTLPLFPLASQYYNPLVSTLALLSIVYASLVTIRQIDLKRIIAYSSIAHMNLIVLGLFSYTQQGIDGAIYLMIAHGVVSTGLFFCVGVLYDRHHTRLLQYYGGLAQTMPIFATLFFVFTLANMGFPATANFIGELLIFVGLFESNSMIMVLAGTGIVFSAVYSIWLYNRLMFGALKLKYLGATSFRRFYDLTFREKYILSYLSVYVILLGLFADPLTELTRIPVALILLRVC